MYGVGRVGYVGQPIQAAGVAAFSPSNIPNMALWLKGNDPATINQTGGFVSQWNDKSGNAYNATQATGANQPTTGVRTVNGKNVLGFSNGLFLSLPSGTYNFANAAGTLFVVYSTDDTASQQRLVNGTTAGASTRFGTRLNFVSDSVDSVNNTAATFVGQSVVKNTTQHISGFRFNGATSGNALRPFYDGIQTSGSGAPASDVAVMSIGGAGNTLNLTGGIAEILFYRREITDAEMNQLGQYLTSEWGTPWTTI